MTQDERTAQDAAARLDARLGELPLEVAPGRDLWPEIAARIEDRAQPVASMTRRAAWLWQAAAAVVLVAGSSLLTASLLDRDVLMQQSAAPAVRANGPAASDAAVVMPAAFGPAGQLDPEYVAARRQLTQLLDQRVAALPPSARAKLEFNLGEMRRAADDHGPGGEHAELQPGIVRFLPVREVRQEDKQRTDARTGELSQDVLVDVTALDEVDRP